MPNVLSPLRVQTFLNSCRSLKEWSCNRNFKSMPKDRVSIGVLNLGNSVPFITANEWSLHILLKDILVKATVRIQKAQLNLWSPVDILGTVQKISSLLYDHRMSCLLGTTLQHQCHLCYYPSLKSEHLLLFLEFFRFGLKNENLFLW